MTRSRRRAAAGLAVLIAAVVLQSPALAQSGETVGRVSDLTGPATVIRDGTPIALRRGADIHATDRLRTLEGAKLEVRFDDGSRLILGADSVVEVARYAPGDGGRGLLDMVQGVLRVVLDKAAAWSSFDVETANAVASARSTEWVVVLSPDGTAVFVVDGRVAVSAQGREIELGPGEGTDVPPDAPPGPVKRWGQGRVDEVLARTTLR